MALGAWTDDDVEAWTAARCREVAQWSDEQRRRVLAALVHELSFAVEGREHWHEAVSVLLGAPELPLPS